jgi:two-component system cell cycle sensor histidine kinase/response regulator CckA
MKKRKNTRGGAGKENPVRRAQTAGLETPGPDDAVLRESEERYRLVAEQTGQLVYDYDVVSGSIKWAGAIQEITGYTFDEFQQIDITAWEDHIHPEDRKKALSLLDKVMNDGAVYQVEYRFRCKDGTYRHMEDRGVFLRDRSGRATRMIGTQKDITERKEAEKVQEAVYRTARAADKSESLDDLFAAVHAIIQEVMPAGNFYISLYDDVTDTISFPYFVDEVDVPAPARKPGRGLTEYILRTGKSLLCDDATFLSLTRAGDVELVGMSSPIWLGVPLIINRKIIGVMVVQHYSDPTAYARRELEIMEFVSSEVARAIDRKRTEEQLKENEEMYRLLFLSHPEPVWVYDTDTLKLLAANDTAVSSYGYSREEFLSMTVYDLHPPEDLATVERELKSLPEGMQQTTGTSHRKKDGSLIDVEVIGTPIKYPHRNARLALAKDVTRRKKDEQQLRLQASALESAANAIVITNREGRIEWVNPAFTGLTGYASGEVLGQNPRILKSGKHPPELYQTLWQTILSGQVWQGEMINRRKDGNLYNEEMTITPVRDANGEISHFIAVKQNVTDKKVLEAQILRSQRMESIGVLAGGIAHDLNNVLSPIMLGIEMLRKRASDENEIKTLDILTSSAVRGAEIVKQVLMFSRGVQGERSLLQPRHIVREIELFSKETFPKSIEIRTSIPMDLWTLIGDATQIHQVLLNLCVNARDAMPNGGTLVIGTQNVYLDEHYVRMHSDAQVGPYVLFRVADTGMGIQDSLRDKIFDPFFTTKEVGKGTGLGLSTVMGLVKAHSGFVNVYSEIGKGSEFKVYIPAVETPQTQLVREQQAWLPRGNGELVLVVDDEVSVREITKATLESFGYRVLAATDGVDAVSLYAQHHREIAVVLTDMAMPLMDGTATIRALQKMDPAVRVIATSGLIAQKAGAESAGGVVKAFIQKPYTAEKLLRLLRDVLDAA